MSVHAGRLTYCNDEEVVLLVRIGGFGKEQGLFDGMTLRSLGEVQHHYRDTPC
ncbi:MAG: hypothetical protein R3A78_03870 [Polyangiales bacterium]|nr:hypothetical protein [Myxococcales bacterium]